MYINSYDYYLKSKLGFTDDNFNKDNLYLKKIYDLLVVFNQKNNNEYDINKLVNCEFNLESCIYIHNKIKELKNKFNNYIWNL